MRAEIQCIASAGLAFSLAACSSSNSAGGPGPIPPEENAVRVFAQNGGATQAVGDALQAGETLTARKVSVIGRTLGYGNGETSLANDASATVRVNDDGELTVSMNGVERAFSTADRKIEPDGRVFGYETTSGPYSGAFSYNGTLDEFLSTDNGYVRVLGVQRSRDDGTGTHDQVFAVFGTETRDGDLAALPTATYSGRTRVNVVPDSGFVNGSTSEIRVRSDLAMTADFGAGEISGNMTNFTQQNPGSAIQEARAGNLRMNPASFTQNGFSSTLTPDSALRGSLDVSNFSGTYSGAFYGPSADQVGGVIGVTGTSPDTGGFNGTGFFTGGKD